MTRRQLSAKLDAKTTGITKFGWNLSPEAIRAAQMGEVYLRTVMDLLDAGSESTVEGADPVVQHLYAQ